MASGEGWWIQLIRRLLHQLQSNPLTPRQLTEGDPHGGPTEGLQRVKYIPKVWGAAAAFHPETLLQPPSRRQEVCNFRTAVSRA